MDVSGTLNCHRADHDRSELSENICGPALTCHVSSQPKMESSSRVTPMSLAWNCVGKVRGTRMISSSCPEHQHSLLDLNSIEYIWDSMKRQF